MKEPNARLLLMRRKVWLEWLLLNLLILESCLTNINKEIGSQYLKETYSQSQFTMEEQLDHNLLLSSLQKPLV